MSSIDDAIKMRRKIADIIEVGIESNGLSFAQQAEIQRLIQQIHNTRERVVKVKGHEERVVKVKNHEAFCAYFGKVHGGTCNPTAEPQLDYGSEYATTSGAYTAPSGLSEQDADVATVLETEQTRYFASGAYRDGQAGKLDYEGFLSPAALLRYAEYMDKNRLQSDNQMRDSDNWQQGIPVASYMKSMWRHFIDAWTQHRKTEAQGYNQDALETSLCAVIFNAFGYLHELMERGGKSDD